LPRPAMWIRSPTVTGARSSATLWAPMSEEAACDTTRTR
jgi:hypothetical protein